MNMEKKEFVKYLIRASIIDIVIPSEIWNFIDEGVFQCANDIKKVAQDNEKFLPHWCNPRCLDRSGPDKL